MVCMGVQTARVGLQSGRSIQDTAVCRQPSHIEPSVFRSLTESASFARLIPRASRLAYVRGMDGQSDCNSGIRGHYAGNSSSPSIRLHLTESEPRGMGWPWEKISGCNSSDSTSDGRCPPEIVNLDCFRICNSDHMIR